jgi:hypothetical protein
MEDGSELLSSPDQPAPTGRGLFSNMLAISMKEKMHPNNPRKALKRNAPSIHLASVQEKSVPDLLKLRRKPAVKIPLPKIRHVVRSDQHSLNISKDASRVV